jgi:hypothetical protein
VSLGRVIVEAYHRAKPGLMLRSLMMVGKPTMTLPLKKAEIPVEHVMHVMIAAVFPFEVAASCASMLWNSNGSCGADGSLAPVLGSLVPCSGSGSGRRASSIVDVVDMSIKHKGEAWRR